MYQSYKTWPYKNLKHRLLKYHWHLRHCCDDAEPQKLEASRKITFKITLLSICVTKCINTKSS